MPYSMDNYESVEDLFAAISATDAAAIEAMARGIFEMDPPPMGTTLFAELDKGRRTQMLLWGAMAWMQLQNEGFRVHREQ